MTTGHEKTKAVTLVAINFYRIYRAADDMGYIACKLSSQVSESERYSREKYFYEPDKTVSSAVYMVHVSHSRRVPLCLHEHTGFCRYADHNCKCYCWCIYRDSGGCIFLHRS